MRIVACLALVACGHSPAVPHAAVIAESGDAPEPGASVVSHRADGTLIDEQTPDPTGVAEVEVEPGALVTVVFPSTPVQLVTTIAPAAGAELVVHGPVPMIPSTGVGALAIMPAMPLAAAVGGFDIQLGCVTVHEPMLPATIDLIGACLGSDLNLDILIFGFDASNAVVGYAAGRVMLQGDVAEFDIPSWSTTGTAVPITLTGVAPALDWTIYTDGMPFDAGPITNPAQLPIGLVVDSVEVDATIAGQNASQVTTLEIAGAPTAIALGTADFLPAIAPALVRAGDTFSWTAASVGADLTDLRVTWDGSVWDAVLPPDASTVTFPNITTAKPPATIMAELRLVDSPGLADFTALDEIFAEQTPLQGQIVALPQPGELRTTRVSL